MASRNSILAANSAKNLSQEKISSRGETETPEENSFPFVKFVQPLIGKSTLLRADPRSRMADAKRRFAQRKTI
jgi:hypothetical protein